MITLNADQQRALGEILDAHIPGQQHLLTGFAGSGKTTLMQAVALAFIARAQSVVLSATTHKAVAVLAAKINQAGIDGVECVTIHSLLSLKPQAQGDRLVFQRSKFADPVSADVVVIDECSMIDEALMQHISRHLPNSFVLFVGDPAQLPPVGEVESLTFSTPRRSHLATIVRQGAGNPILAAANTIRESQGTAKMDWSWLKSVHEKPLGVYLPADPDQWMRRAFTSAGFEQNPDSFRYLCWTNDRVAQVNNKIRIWRYGANIPTPFMPGERTLIRSPVVIQGNTLLSTNEEADVISIERDSIEYFPETYHSILPWVADLATWRVELRKQGGEVVTVHMVRDDSAYNAILARITDEARICSDRWGDLHSFKSSLARLQSVYALTVHTSQGSTFVNAFVDVGDIRRRAKSNVLETQQLLYVAATRPTHALMLVNA